MSNTLPARIRSLPPQKVEGRAVSTDETCPGCKRTGWVMMEESESAADGTDQLYTCTACGRDWWEHDEKPFHD